jgi:hypothetical protein
MVASGASTKPGEPGEALPAKRQVAETDSVAEDALAENSLELRTGKQIGRSRE